MYVRYLESIEAGLMSFLYSLLVCVYFLLLFIELKNYPETFSDFLLSDETTNNNNNNSNNKKMNNNDNNQTSIPLSSHSPPSPSSPTSTSAMLTTDPTNTL
jgi:hypothetical protein